MTRFVEAHDLEPYAINTGEFYQTHLALVGKDLGEWMEHVRQKVLTRYCKEIEPVKLANDVNIAVATKLMGYYIRHTNESKALADSERSGLPPTPWEFRGNGDTFAIVDKNDRLVFELPYIEETDKEPLDTASGRLVVMIVDAVNAKGRNDQT